MIERLEIIEKRYNEIVEELNKPETLSDYNNMMNTTETLAEDECLIFSNRLSYQWSAFTMENAEKLRVKEQMKEFRAKGEATVSDRKSVV